MIRLDRRLAAPLLISLILLGSHFAYGVLRSYQAILLAIAASVLTEVVLSRLVLRQKRPFASAYITGISVGILIHSPMLWPYALGGALSIMSKYVLRLDGRHLWNPSNFGICVLLFLAPFAVAPLSVQWGNDVWPMLVIWAIGLYTIWTAKRLHVTASYIAAFVVFALVRSLVTGDAFLAEVAPITGPMYQLFALFMVTDPKTTVSSRKWEVVVVVIVAFVEMLLRLGEVIYAPFYALFLVGPTALVIETFLRRRAASSVVVAALVVLFVAGGCSGAAELEWTEEDGHRWADVSTGRFGGAGFEEVAPSRSGVSFANHVTDEQIAENRHVLNGGGVAAGDVDGDGRIDLYFGAVAGRNALYRNLGGFEFEDVTDSAGVALEGHSSSGVVLADIDGDGDLDLLVGSIYEPVAVLLNDGAGRFQRSDAGLGSTGGKGTSTLALADVDGDGDLDLYVTNYRERSISDRADVRTLTWENTVEDTGREGDARWALRPEFAPYYVILTPEGEVPERREVGEPDQLFLNDGDGTFTEADAGTRFLDVDGAPAGLSRDWGLAARFHDLNGDRRPDLFVANDFWTPDRIWINQGGGVFRAIDSLAIRSLSFSSMAVDFSDVDRDGAVDLFVTEMLGTSHEQRARHYIPSEPFPENRFETRARPQANRNSLYVGRGDGTYAETAYYSGLESSGWSWGTLFLDVDLDGYEDLLVANGFAFDLQDLDTQLRMNREVGQGMRPSRGHLLNYPPLPEVNRAFRNHGDRTFTDASGEWGFEREDIAQGLALADLDDDGDLDLVSNRYDETAAIYENRGRAPRIAVRLRGADGNTQAIGAAVSLEGGPVRQEKELVSGGGYLSGSDPQVTFAAGDDDGDRTLVVTWLDGRTTTVDGVVPDRIYEIEQAGADPAVAAVTAMAGSGASPADTPASDAGGPASAVRAGGGDPNGGGVPAFEDVSEAIAHVHHEDPFDDWWLQPLLPVGLSRQGPGVAWVDLDADGDEDLLVGAGRGGSTGAFENRGDGTFAPVGLEALAGTVEGDQTTLLGWAAGSGVTLAVGSANLEQGNVGAPAARIRRLGGGGPSSQDLPDNLSATGPLAAADYDGDGDIDLFVGGRYVPARWPEAASSRLFRNHDGEFVPDRRADGALGAAGLVTGAVFTDYDVDGDPDLLLSLEWGPLRLLRNDGGAFRDVSEDVGLAGLSGWWGGVATGDFNADGRPDIVATNWGLNSPYRPNPEHPPRIHYADFNWDRRMDVVETYWDDDTGGWVPRRQMRDFETVANALLVGVSNNRHFAASTLEDLTRRPAGSTPHLELTELRSVVLLNGPDGFTVRPLPAEAQLSAAFAAVVADYDADGREDVFIGQNVFYVQPDLPRQDAGRGLWLRGDGRGGFEAVPGQVSGVTVYGQQRGAAAADFDGDGRVDLAVAQNSGATRLFRNRSERRGVRVRLVGPPANRDAIGASLRLVYDDGSRGPLREVQAGSGYWSQNGAAQILGVPPSRTVTTVEVRWPDGSAATAAVSTLTVTIRHDAAGKPPES